MKKNNIRILALVLLAALLLTACAPKVIEVDLDNKTITHGDLVYTYKQQTKSNIRTITITYPNGGHYTWTDSQGETSYQNGKGDLSYDPANSDDGDVLIEHILNAERGIQPENEHRIDWLLVVMGIFTAAMGAWIMLKPYLFFKIRYGWRYENGEPSDMGLGAVSAGGFITLLGGIVFILIGIL